MLRRDSFAPVSGRRAACVCALAIVWVLGVAAEPASAQPAPPRPSFRVFLIDGTPLLSAGEFVRSDGRVVFSMPIGGEAEPGALQVISLPDAVIDWIRTNRYADAVRFRRYAASQGEDDYLALSNQVARALSDMAFAPDAETKVRIGEAIRRQLVEWPADHLGYRAADVGDMTAIVEESLTDVRATSGQQAFDLNLVASIEPPAEPLLPEPTVEESVGLARLASRAADSSLERVSLQSAILVVLAQRRAASPEPWMRSAERLAKESLAFEGRVDRQYGELSQRTRAAAAAASSRGDVGAIESLVSDVKRQDDRLGRRRPDTIWSLVDALKATLEVARNNRLALDRWQYRLDVFGAYKRVIEAALSRIAKHGPDVDAVRRLAGPNARRLADTDRDLAQLEVSLLPVAPPPDVKDTHDTMLAAIRLLREAVRLRREAVVAGNMDAAYNASSAAAGGWLLSDRVRAHIADYFRRPSPE
jgi:hypothetical protein